MGVELTQARPYLDALFGNNGAGEYLLIWTLPDKRSAWFADVDAACAALVSPAYENKDVYAGMCTSPADMGPTRRCDAANVASMGGLWADIDIGTVGHQKENLPRSIDDVMAVLAAYPKPSLIVGTGHGIHVYWLFRERFVIRNAADNAAASEMGERWQRWLLRGMQERGWTLDMTWDLARILRVPGTTNRKNKVNPLPVTLIENNGVQYDWLELSKLIPGDIQTKLPTVVKAGGIGALKLSENQILDGDVLNALRKKYKAKFEDSFDRVKSLPGGDQSASAYDASLAMYGVLMGCSDQQIADLIIVSRRTAGQDLKLRQDYYSNTISSARAMSKKADGIDELINQAQSTSESQDALGISPEEAKQRVLDSLSTVLGVRVDRIVKYDIDPDPMFWMEVAGSRRFLVGTVDIIMEERKFKNKIIGNVSALLPDFKRADWEKIALLIIRSAEQGGGAADGRFEDSTKSFMREYLLATKIGDDPNEAMTLGGAFMKDDRVYVSLESLKKWLYYTRHQDIKDQTLAQYLSNVGCVSKQFTFTLRSSGKQVGRRVWQVPSELIPGTG